MRRNEPTVVLLLGCCVTPVCVPHSGQLQCDLIVSILICPQLTLLLLLLFIVLLLRGAVGAVTSFLSFVTNCEGNPC